MEELQIFTAPHFKEAATDETGRRIGRHMEIQIFDGENELEEAYFSTDWVMAAYSWPKLHKGSMEMTGY